jgi:hypothetical protein
MALEAWLGHRHTVDQGDASLANHQANKSLDPADTSMGTQYHPILLAQCHRGPTN